MKIFLAALFLIAIFMPAHAQEIPVLNQRVNNTVLSLSWTASKDADRYKLYYAPLPYTGPETIEVIDMGQLTEISAPLPVGSQFGIAITSFSNGIESSFSNIAYVDIKNDNYVINSESSYLNSKGQNFHNLSFPIVGWERWTSTVNVFAFDDFRRVGKSDLFTATIRYDTSAPYGDQIQYDDTLKHNIATDSSYLSDLVFWKKVNGEWEEYYETRGCLHPRKALSVDFNNDGYTDIFIACTGWDGGAPLGVENWAGEPSIFLKNNGDGTFEKIKIGENRYYHGASAGDINRDGLVDILVVDVTKDWNLQGIYALINEGNFRFEEDYTYITPQTRNNITIELIDIDGDLDFDLVVGPGDEGQANQATLLYKFEGGEFNYYKEITAISDRGVVLDFVYKTELCRTCIYILRTADISSGAFYNSITIQKYDFDSEQSEVIYDHLDNTGGGKWLAWIVPNLNENGTWSLKPYSSTYNLMQKSLPVRDFGK